MVQWPKQEQPEKNQWTCYLGTYKGIHDKINPQELHSLERSFSINHSTNKGNHDGNNVDSELKLNKLKQT